MAGGVGGQALGNEQGVGNCLRRQNREQPIATRIAEHALERSGVAAGVGIAQYVHGIAVAPAWRQLLIERLHRRWRERGQLPARLQ